MEQISLSIRDGALSEPRSCLWVQELFQVSNQLLLLLFADYDSRERPDCPGCQLFPVVAPVFEYCGLIADLTQIFISTIANEFLHYAA